MNHTARHIDLAELRAKAAEIRRLRMDAIEELRRLTTDAAEKERTYRKTKAIAFTKAKADASATEAEVRSNGEAADARYARDVAQGLVTAQREFLGLLERDSATLRTVSDWSMKIEHLVA